MTEKAPVNFTSGVFDKPRQPRLEPRKAPGSSRPEITPTQESSEPVPQKEAFPDPFKEQARMTQETMLKMKHTDKAEEAQTDQINKINEAMESKNLNPMDEEKVTAEEMSLAEQLIFKGYAETQVEMGAFPGKKFAICSTNAEELSMIDEVVFDMVKGAKSNSDGTVDLPENHLVTMRNAVFVALSYRGIDGKDLAPDAQYYLNSLKKGVYLMNEMYNDGKIDEANKLKESLKKAIIKRATLIKRLPTPLIDFLSGEKLRFDSKMSRIMGLKTIVPKS